MAATPRVAFSARHRSDWWSFSTDYNSSIVGFNTLPARNLDPAVNHRSRRTLFFRKRLWTKYRAPQTGRVRQPRVCPRRNMPPRRPRCLTRSLGSTAAVPGHSFSCDLPHPTPVSLVEIGPCIGNVFLQHVDYDHA